MFNILLCIPPDYDRHFPPLGTPALAAYHKKKGYACSQADLNVRYRDFLADHVSGPGALTGQERLFFLQPLLTRFFAHCLKDRYYSGFLPVTSDRIFPHLPYGNNTNSSFYFCERLLSSDLLWRYLDDRDENTFYRFFEQEGIIESLEKQDIRLFGISITSPSQAVAGLTLGLMVKSRCPHIHVTIGGQWPTLFRDVLFQRKDLFRCFDSVVVFEGETALYGLAKRLERGGHISSIPNVITPDTVPANAPIRPEEDLNDLPCPDFDGLMLADYDGSKDGQISLTFETSRGCYWSKCAYCVDLPLPKPSYRVKSANRIAQDMQELKDRYNAQYLLFGDPGLSPRQMRQVSQQILKDHIGMEWWTMARLDPGFDAALFDLAHAAGLQQVNFGFETASDRISRLLDKGNIRDRSSRIIRDCAAAGIKVDLQTMLGLPGETFEEGMETIDFLVSHRQYISHVTFNTYYLTPGNHVYDTPGRYGIEYDKGAGLPFRFFIPFRNIHGIDMEKADMLERMYYALMHKGDGAAAALEPAVPCHLSDGYADLTLPNGSYRLRYRRDPVTETYTFLDDGPESRENVHAAAVR